MNITGHTISKLEDPMGLLTGERYEFILHIEVPIEDELHSEKGIFIRAILVTDEKGERIAQYHLIEKETNQHLDFELEQEEEEMIITYCKNHFTK
ncbi:DUF6509 family protein [Cytobacillus sp. S13-E01]|uniref:DUF6509 family protein n=1 Tax=Cytobacillus sp. S13-E01 TaxID=3031326 RepID=UPI0023D7CB5F|nr:DUF6509 family protein [Cytobacillus sp. S13-E01]MDF0727869.1 DUF6509 family protein [Cytobacillus sp. S13-E01]